MRMRLRWLLGGALIAACSSGGGVEREETGKTSLALSASSVLVDVKPLSTNGGVVSVRIWNVATGVTVGVVAKNQTLPPLPDGIYNVTNYTLTSSFGSFEVTLGEVVDASGAITIGASSISFDRAALAPVHVPQRKLSVPAGRINALRLGDLTVWGDDATFWLPDGSFDVTDYVDAYKFGSFVVAGKAVVSGSGGVVPAADGIDFDLSRFASVKIPFGGLSSPANLLIYRFPSLSGAINGDVTYYLPSGTYRLTDYGGTLEYGSFTVADTSVVGGGGAIVPAADGIAFDMTKLASVRVPASTLSTPTNLFPARLLSADGNGLGGTAFDATFRLPDGTYRVSDAQATKVFGTFTVAEHAVAGVSGTLATAPDGISFDRSKLATVTVPLGAFTTPSGQLYGRITSSGNFGASGRADPTFFLPGGTYAVTDASQTRTYGTFTVAGTALSSTSGALAISPSDGALVSDKCSLAGVDIALRTGRTTSLVGYTETLRTSVTAWLVPGAYSFADGSSFVIAADKSIGSVSLATNGAIASIAPRSCQVPPTTSCVGTASSPIVLPTACSATVDAVNGLAGTCSGGGGGLASCTFDGLASRTLGPGDHAVAVVGTAADGSTSTCTSYVRVTACPVPPAVTCLGTVASPVRLAVPSGTCGVRVDAANGLAGTCADAGSGVAACTYDGAPSEVLSPGAHTIVVRGTSNDGSDASCSSYVDVVDAEAPAIACAAPATVECSGATTRISASATCDDNCGTCSVDCATGMAGLGNHSLTCTSLDASGNRSSCERSVAVVDTKPPSIAVAVSPSVLWPPEHQLVPIAITTSANDACDSGPIVACTASSSESPLSKGSGRTIPDVVWTDGHLYLRAERSGPLVGRTYTVTCTARDASGNVSSSSATVTVPHD